MTTITTERQLTAAIKALSREKLEQFTENIFRVLFEETNQDPHSTHIRFDLDRPLSVDCVDFLSTTEKLFQSTLEILPEWILPTLSLISSVSVSNLIIE